MGTKRPPKTARIATLLCACTIGWILAGCGSPRSWRSVSATIVVAATHAPLPDSKPNLDPDGAPAPAFAGPHA